MKKVKCVQCNKKFKPITIEYMNLILSPKNCNKCRSNNQPKTKPIAEPVHKSFFDYLNDDYETNEDRVIEYYYKIVL